MVHSSDLFVIGGGVRSSGHHRNAGPVAPLDHGVQGIALNDHGGGQHQVGPLQVRFLQGGHIQIHHAEVVSGRKHTGDGEQAQRRKACLLADKFQGEFSAPVGRWEFRINQECIWHDNDLQSACYRGRISNSATRGQPGGFNFSGPLYIKFAGIAPRKLRPVPLPLPCLACGFSLNSET